MSDNESMLKKGLNKWRRALLKGLATINILNPLASQAQGISSQDSEPQAKHYVMPEQQGSKDVEVLDFNAQNSTSYNQEAKQKKNSQYKTTVECVNDSVPMVGDLQGYYSKADKKIHVMTGDMKMSDFFSKARDTQVSSDLVMVHEGQHQVNDNKLNNAIQNASSGIGLSEYYQCAVHDEIIARMAEKLEIRRQYKEAKTKEEKKAVLDKFANAEGNIDYIKAIKSGRLNPDSSLPSDFSKEMAFIKDNTTQFVIGNNGNGYEKNWQNATMVYYNEMGDKAQSNPELFQSIVRDMYQIGGIDFTKFGEHSDQLLENQNVKTVEKLASQGASKEQLNYFIATNHDVDLYKIADSIDITGLSREQAEKVIQTAIVTQECSFHVAEAVSCGKQANLDFNYISGQLQKKIATYLVIHEDIWEKNHQLTPEGDSQKFEECMNQAKTITVDTKSWYASVASPGGLWYGHFNFKSGGGQAAIAERVEQNHGKNVNIDDVLKNPDEFSRPLGDKSAKEVFEDIQIKERQEREEDEKFFADFYERHPEEKRSRQSSSYEVEITDFQSSILKDEYNERINKSRLHSIESIGANDLNKSVHIGEGKSINFNLNQTYKSAEICNFYREDGLSAEVTLIDGKPHGLASLKDSSGKIIELKLYDNGKEVDLTNVNLNIEKYEEAGNSANIVTLGGKMFGTFIQINENNDAKVGFFDSKGRMMQSHGNTQIIQRVASFDDMPINFDFLKTDAEKRAELAASLKQQKGALPNSSAEVLTADAKIDEAMSNRQQDPESNNKSGSRTQRSDVSSNIMPAKQFSR